MEWVLNDVYRAAAEGDAILLEHLLSQIKKSEINEKHPCNEHGNPVHFAAMNGHLHIVEMLIRIGMNINAKRNDGCTPLHLACRGNHSIIVESLVQNGAEINAVDCDGNPPIFVAAEVGNLSILTYLISQGAWFHMRNKLDYTALHIGTYFGKTDVVMHLIKCGADIYAASRVTGCVPFFSPALHGSYELMHQMIHHLPFPVNINYRSREGCTVLFIAVRYNRVNIVELLLENGATVDLLTNQGQSVLHLASSIEVCKLLLYFNANINAIDCEGNTILHEKMQTDTSIEVVKLLLDSGVPLNGVNSEGRTALHLAAGCERIDLYLLLLQYNPIDDIRDDFGDTPFDLVTRDEDRLLITQYYNWKRRKDLVLFIYGSNCFRITSEETETNHYLINNNYNVSTIAPVSVLGNPDLVKTIAYFL